MRKNRKVQLEEIQVPVQFLREGKYFIAYCPVLDITTQAISFEKAQKRFHELIQIFFEELCELGTLEKHLNEMGWVKSSKPKKWIPLFEFVSKETIQCELPVKHSCRV